MHIKEAAWQGSSGFNKGILAAELIALDHDIDLYANFVMQNGAKPSGIFTTEQVIPDAKYKEIASRLKDSLLNVIIKRIYKKEFSVAKPDKKLGFFKVNASTNDELLSVYLSERMIKIATDFYVNNKTSRLKNNVARLEHRTDSIGKLLNDRTYSAVNDMRLMLNLNPADISAQSSSEISQRDKIVLSTIYAELIKNLEISKTALVQETPTIQITDKPILPLEKEEMKWYEGLLFGFFAPVIFLFVILAI
jgi:hypothetical protein